MDTRWTPFTRRAGGTIRRVPVICGLVFVAAVACGVSGAVG